MHNNCRCLKCGHVWHSNLMDHGIPPRACANCKRYDWQLPRIRKSKKKG